jgi:hypothetical protein
MRDLRCSSQASSGTGAVVAGFRLQHRHGFLQQCLVPGEALCARIKIASAAPNACVWLLKLNCQTGQTLGQVSPDQADQFHVVVLWCLPRQCIPSRGLCFWVRRTGLLFVGGSAELCAECCVGIATQRCLTAGSQGTYLMPHAMALPCAWQNLAGAWSTVIAWVGTGLCTTTVACSLQTLPQSLRQGPRWGSVCLGPQCAGVGLTRVGNA